MLLRKEGFPEDDELVLCTVAKIFHYGVFVELDEYGRSGLIHISEVSPGRIRNIRDFVVEGKKVVCKVLKVDAAKGNIDLSLRRVNAGQKKEKINEIKQEQKAEKIIEFAAKKLGIDAKKAYDEVYKKASEKYGLMHLFFEDVVKGGITLENAGISGKIAGVLTEFINERMKPAEIFVEGELQLKIHSPDGVEVIRAALKKAVVEGSIEAIYEGGGKYRIKAKANEYKHAEKALEKSVNNSLEFIKKNSGEGSFTRKQ